MVVAGLPHGTLSFARVSHNLATQRRRIQLCLSPRLMLARGRAADAIVRTGVHQYLELQVVDATFLARQADDEGKLLHVPWSKSDIFKNRDLSVMDKRSLMKFLRVIIDDSVEGDVDTFNERELGRVGR